LLVQRVLLDAGDTLCIEPIQDARWGTPEWKAKQLEVLSRGTPATSPKP
jgi:hypothetical protein